MPDLMIRQSCRRWCAWKTYCGRSLKEDWQVAPLQQALHLTGAAILVSRGIKVLQAAPAGELYH